MPITSAGYERSTRDAVLLSIQGYLRDKISLKLDLGEATVLGNVSNLMADHIDQLEQLIEEAYHAYDVDNASDDRFVAIALASGVPRRGPTKSRVGTLVVMDAGITFAPGELIAHVVDEPDNRWVNRDEIVSVGAGGYPAVFESELPGAFSAPALTLYIQVTTPTGWTAVNNIADSTPGSLIEAIPTLRIRREIALSVGGSKTRGAIRSKIALLDGVVSVEVFDNVSSTTDADGILPHGLRVVVWDGSPAGANDDEIAQVIYDNKAEGILSQGLESGIAHDSTDSTLGPVTVAFDRASTSAVTVAVNIESTSGVNVDDIKAAIMAAMPTRVGHEVTFNRLASSVFSVLGVDDWVTFTVNGAGADLAAVQNLIYLLDGSDITVTGDVT